MSAVAARLQVVLHELRLPPVKRLWAALAERDTRRLERHRLESQLLPGKRLSNFDFKAVPTVSKAHVTALTKVMAGLNRGPIFCCSGRRVRARPTGCAPSAMV